MKPLEGQLSKYTNVMKGWQYRWFVVSPDFGTLEYYVNEEVKKHRPRGGLHLAGAVISPSDEDSQTFTVNSANGDVYKLRAVDAKERQHWVNGLRSVAQYHTEVIAQKNPPLPPREQRSSATPSPGPTPREGHSLLRAQQRVMCSTASLYDAFSSAREVLLQSEFKHQALAGAIESLPSTGVNIKCTDPDLLLLKAASQATLLCMEQCLSILQHQHQASSYSISGVAGGATTEWIDPRAQYVKLSTSSTSVLSRSSLTPSLSQSKTSLTSEPEPDPEPVPEPVAVPKVPSETSVISDDEVPDSEEYCDSDLGTVEEHKSVILHLLSQLKLGMDLTRVVLPTFILERRSLLEMFADFMGHPDLFVMIPEHSTPEQRMLSMVEWYLTSFHVGRKGAIAKKPYNPIIGENFTCSWHVNKKPSGDSMQGPGDPIRIRYTAEQVSHHPPISAFYVECPEKKMYLNAHVWTKSKFMGMSIGVSLIGDVVLYLLEHDEEYTFQLPSAFARSILTVPWVELGGKITISSPKTGYTSHIMFHTKPFYGGKLHKVTAEVKNPTGSIICRVQGEWNGVLEFIYADGEVKVIDTSQLPVLEKRVRPLEKQNDFESRKLWHGVTSSLREGNIDAATTHKKRLEDRQRTEERQRLETKEAFPTKFFKACGDGWVYHELPENISSINN